MVIYPYMIGATYESMAYLETLKIVAPLQAFKPYAIAVERGDGAVLGQGWAQVKWYWSFISEAERDILKGYCTGLSAEVYIRTLDEELDWHTYRTVMIWPVEAEDRQVGASIKFELTFRIKEEIAEP